MKNTYKTLVEDIKSVEHYYTLLVEETKSQRLVGSTNEWVLDNYYMISEQEKVLREDLRSKGFRQIGSRRLSMLTDLLRGFLDRCHFQVDKAFLMRYLSHVQVQRKDYLSYAEVCGVLPLLKAMLIGELAALCRRLEAEGAYHYSPTDKAGADMEKLGERAKDNLLMMNIFNSLKKVTRMPVSQMIDQVSATDRVLKNEHAAMYDEMMDRTKDDYRAQLSRLAKRRHTTEYELAKSLVAEADAEGKHVGLLLFPPKRWKLRSRIYVWGVALATLALAAVAAMLAAGGWNWTTLVLTLLAVVPLSQLVIDVSSQVLYRLHKPRGTFKLKFKDGLIPREYATMVIMPTILKDARKTEAMLDQLEVYYLSNINRASEGRRMDSRGQNLYYTLVGDAAAAPEADMPWDDEVAAAGERKVRELNEKYGAPIFNFVYRRRAWSDGERCFLGWERKRGAILHFNDLLLGNFSEAQRREHFRCETVSQWLRLTAEDGHCPITFVITLDTDTELVLYSAQKLIGAMAHPLNRARLSADGMCVEAGYGIMQPRVNVDVEVTNKSRYAQLFSGLGGLDVYTTASFELYQDIFDEGSFCGKGIYDLRVFQQVLRGRFPQNLILSHDLLEGCHIRCGLINDVELYDDSPSNYIDDAKRHHRWTRGDWQIIGWLRGRVRNERGDLIRNVVNTIGRWKIFDNLRRSVLSLALMVVILVGFALPLAYPSPLSAAWYVVLALVAVASPIVFFVVGQVTKVPRFGRRYKYYMTLMRGFRVIVDRSLVQFALLPKEAWMYTDALVRACWRMTVSHRALLAWITSDEAARSTKGTLGEYLRKFWPNYVAAAAVLALAFAAGGGVWGMAAAVFCALAWLTAPVVMYHLGRKFPQEKRTLAPAETDEVRQLARDTWHFFDTFLTEETHWLIPDNYQVGREPLTDYKTSPTNIGYSLTAVVSAASLGFIGNDEAVRRLEHIIGTVEQLEKWNGHLYNWYDIHSLRKLPNYFVSTADSGNFVACLYAVKGFLLGLVPYVAAQPQPAPSAATEPRPVPYVAAQPQPALQLAERVSRLIVQTDFMKLYNPELDVFSIGFDDGAHCLLPYHYNNFASEARLTSFLTIAQGDAPYKHWFCLDKTLVQYHGYKGVASWYGTMFEYFMPLIFLPTFRHTLMDETYSFAIRAQRAFVREAGVPWGISETAYNELDDARNYKYHAFGVPYLKFQNTTPDRIVISPYSSLMAIGVDDRAVYDNMRALKRLGMYDEYGFFESYDEEDRVPVRAHYAHHQGMILASLANYLHDNILQTQFMSEPAMQSMMTLLKEKAQVKPYIDLKVTQYKRYQYSKEQTESDAREFDTVATVPEVGVLSNGRYTVLLNDRGSGFSRYKNILLNRYRKISSDHYGTYLFVRNLRSDRLWSATYAPLDTMPDHYRVSFASDKVEYSRTDEDIETRTEVTVLKDRYAELRRYTFTNRGADDADLELTTYSEWVLATAAEDENHRVFSGMQLHTSFDADRQMLVASRPVQEGATAVRHYAIHKLFVEDPADDRQPAPPEYETSRLKFLGRGNSLPHAEVMRNRRTLSQTVGTTLDPIASMRRRVHVPAGKQVEVYLLMGFSKSYEQLEQLSDTFRTAVDIDQAFRAASVFNNIRTSMSLLKGVQMRLYNSIGKYISQTANLGAGRQQMLARNTLSQSSLWRFGISGDLPILLVEIHDIARSGYAKETLRAFEYYKVHGLILDVVFINDETGENREGLSHFIRNIANTEHLWATHTDAGRVYILNGSDLSEAERVLLHTVAQLSFNTREGLTIQQQLERLEQFNLHYQDMVEYPTLKPITKFHVWSSLDFYNQYGGFSDGGRDYVVTNTNTPMPWVNVIANQGFGCVVSSTMAGFTFAHNAQQFKLTGWSNDIVRDNASEMLLVNKQQFVPATARHGQGWSAFDAEYADLKVMVRVFVAVERPEKYYQIKIRNKTGQPLQASLDLVCKFVLGQCEEQTARFLYAEFQADANRLALRNVYHETYRDTTVYLSASRPLTDVDIDYPNRKRVGLTLDLPAGGEQEAAFILAAVGKGQSPELTTSLDAIYREFDAVVASWDERLSHIQVDTPDPAFNHMLNRWYLYQVYSARLFARAGFYQVGGATGFRDQLQDVMSVLYSDPAYARRQILDHAAHQFAEGDVLHWWHESLLLGARTTFSDDYLWLVYVTHQYIAVTGDTSILAEQVAFVKGDHLADGEAERGIRYTVADPKVIAPDEPLPGASAFEYASLYEHLRRAVDRSMHRIGAHGLPLMGCGDWNDGMSRVGVEGRGESVWVAFFLVDLLPKMEHLTQLAPDADLTYCAELASFRQRLTDALQANAWDGSWFLRAYFDNGHPMGSRNNTECQIDLISQAWSILTDVATPEQKESVFRETDARLVNREHEIIQLLTPAFQQSADNPGYIMRYPVGVRENGGQYTHGAMWYIMAQLKEGHTDMAYFLYSLINPIHRTSTLADVLKYKVEPFCIAADIYSNPQHPGRGGWTWYTGSASWAYKTGIENILGFHLEGNRLTLAPQIPSEWDGFTIRYRHGRSTYVITYRRRPDTAPLTLTLVDDGQEHLIEA